MPHRAFIGIGTNLGDRAANYAAALARIGKLRETKTIRQSSIYETDPVGELPGPFLNGAIEIETELSPQVLMAQLLAVERAMGRKRPAKAKPGKHLPRIIDLDLLFYDNEVIESPGLRVPHPRLHERRFVLAPMSELAPALIHPRLNASISELLAGLKSPQRVSLRRADSFKAGPARGEIVSR
ncbi:MAG TPA: 2-amino-4-hydroxy-6-hydroxymethyldihydropteridine diphosphokinase [Candidatus Binataceae bacterium]|nr:2-amino-4-hydroxy-6-hydroxymethyldihydropteridine diphosphokinase [Candidatus Binataceae bacterium]